jgi:hypothetical protein
VFDRDPTPFKSIRQVPHNHRHYDLTSRAGIFCALGVIRFLMIVLGCRRDLVWHRGRKGNGDGKASHGNDERGY